MMCSMGTAPSAGLRHRQKSSATRITVTIPPPDYKVIRRMAKAKKVSASWIVRDAVEKYIQGEPR